VSDFDFDLFFRIGDEVQAARFSQSQVIGTGFVVEMTFFRRDRNAIFDHVISLSPLTRMQ